MRTVHHSRLFGLALAGALGVGLATSGCVDQLECSEDAGSVVGNFFYGLDESGTDNHLRAVDSRGDLMIAVGDRGVITSGDPAGQTWTLRDSGTEEDLLGVATLDGERVVAVGTNGTVIRSEDGGVTWVAMESGTDAELRSITTVTGGFVAIGEGVGIWSEDAGETWTATDALEGLSLRDISQLSGPQVYAVGDAGQIARSSDGGKSWTTDVVSSQFADLDLLSVSFRNADEGRIGTNSGRILVSTNSGTSWSNDGAVTGAALGIAVVNTETWVAADAPAVFYRHHTDPAYVERILSTGAERFEDVRVTPNGDAVMVGENGVVLRGLLDYDVINQYCFQS